MSRPILDSSHIHEAIQDRVANYHASIVEEVKGAIADNDLVIVGMKGNPHCKQARKLLDKRSAEYSYLEYGSYLGEWRKRSALKMWTGWPTFPMVFHKGTLIGGASDLEALLESKAIEI
jgi:glutaredoxin-related protein